MQIKIKKKEQYINPRTNNPGPWLLENIVGKGENAGIQHFLLFPQCFLSKERQFLCLEPFLNCRLLMFSIWTSLDDCRGVKSKTGKTTITLALSLSSLTRQVNFKYSQSTLRSKRLNKNTVFDTVQLFECQTVITYPEQDKSMSKLHLRNIIIFHDIFT